MNNGILVDPGNFNLQDVSQSVKPRTILQAKIQHKE